MPIHDWTRVRAGTFHFFHQRWIQAICDALNGGVLPPGIFAMSEQDAKGPIPDVLALKSSRGLPDFPEGNSGVAVAETPPSTLVISKGENTAAYAQRADRIAIRLAEGELLAVIEIVSPGNKDSVDRLRTFVRKARKLIRRGVHLLVLDLFPPGPRTPDGIHPLIWRPFSADSFTLSVEKPLTLVGYDASAEKVAYVQPVAVGDTFPDMPIFLPPAWYIPCPLEATYQTTWNVFPKELKVHFA